MELKEVIDCSDSQERHEAMQCCSAQESIGSYLRRQHQGGRGEGTDRAAWRMRKAQRRESGMRTGTSFGPEDGFYLWSKSDSYVSLTWSVQGQEPCYVC